MLRQDALFKLPKNQTESLHGRDEYDREGGKTECDCNEAVSFRYHGVMRGDGMSLRCGNGNMTE